MINQDDLARLLGQPRLSGTYRFPEGSAHAIERTARRLGFAVVECDLAHCADKADFLTRVAAALHFPEWFGHNWDALSDCLADLSWLPAGGYVVVLTNVDRFSVANEADFVTALEVFGEAASDWARDGVPMWIFVGLLDDRIGELHLPW